MARETAGLHWKMSIETVLTDNVNLPRACRDRVCKYVYRSSDPSDASVYDVRLYLWRGVDDHARGCTSARKSRLKFADSSPAFYPDYGNTKCTKVHGHLFRKMEDTDLGIIFRDRSCIIYIVDFWTISFFFERQRKTENDNYWGSP